MQVIERSIGKEHRAHLLIKPFSLPKITVLLTFQVISKGKHDKGHDIYRNMIWKET
jgi:hypothetical protein